MWGMVIRFMCSPEARSVESWQKQTLLPLPIPAWVMIERPRGTCPAPFTLCPDGWALETNAQLLHLSCLRLLAWGCFPYYGKKPGHYLGGWEHSRIYLNMFLAYVDNMVSILFYSKLYAVLHSPFSENAIPECRKDLVFRINAQC